MIVVDTSVWIDQIKGIETREVALFRERLPQDEIIVGDLVLLELLQGARDDAHARKLELQLQAFQNRSMLNDAVVQEAARIYRRLRADGITIRKTADLIIATFCIVNGHELLQNDRDFLPIAARFRLTLL